MNSLEGMNKKFRFRVNEIFELALEEEGTYYKTIIQEVSENYIIIGLPVSKGETLLLYEDDRVILKKIRADAVYYFSSEITARLNDDNVPLYKLCIPRMLQRIQRRGYVRVPCILLTYYRVHKEGEGKPEEGKEPDFLPAETVDISGGGIKFISDKEMSPGQNLEIKLKLPRREVKAVGQVITIQKISDNRSKYPIYRISLKFTRILERDREEIIAFIFRKLREWM
ncbi:MAG: hypothetical protein CVU88_03910 [Firmicutes bacterium HGW-Firmicutes-13]|nr:MAG: hypothetical protein CVU88_03910 [Firmicutes bacterium HGW-Firmicutes-13]